MGAAWLTAAPSCLAANPLLAGRGIFPNLAGVTVLLRLIGVMNAAVWFGGSLFFTLAIAPTFFTPEMKRLFVPSYADAAVGLIAQLVLQRYFVLQYWCGAIAVVHQLAEWVYLGRALPRLSLYFLAGVIGIGLAGGLWFQPKLKRLHEVRYGAEIYHRELSTPEMKAAAGKSFTLWHAVSQIANGLALVGLAYYTWNVINPPDPTRFIPATTPKFRS